MLIQELLELSEKGNTPSQGILIRSSFKADKITHADFDKMLNFLKSHFDVEDTYFNPKENVAEFRVAADTRKFLDKILDKIPMPKGFTATDPAAEHFHVAEANDEWQNGLLENAFKQWADENRAKKERERKEKQKTVSAKKENSKAEKAKLETQLYQRVLGAISNAFPDGDPLDQFHGFMSKNNFTMDDVNRLFKKHEGVSYDRYMINAWDGAAGDAASDANQSISKGKNPDASPYYSWKKGDKKVTLEPNPWKG